MTQTNNRAELSAAIAALWAVRVVQLLCIVTDSKYVFGGATIATVLIYTCGNNYKAT